MPLRQTFPAVAERISGFSLAKQPSKYSMKVWVTGIGYRPAQVYIVMPSVAIDNGPVAWESGIG